MGSRLVQAHRETLPSSTPLEHPIEYWEERLLGKKVYFKSKGEEIPETQEEVRIPI